LKVVVEYFAKKGVLFKSFKKIDKTLLKTRKKADIFASTDTKGNYHSIFIIEQKSRFLLKNAIEIVELEDRLQQLEKHNFKYKQLIICKAICSKSIAYMRERGWQFHHDFM